MSIALVSSSSTAGVTPTLGGQETVSTVATSGAAQTINPSTANIFDITLTAACTITLGAGTSGKGCGITVILRQDATGSRTVTWPGSVSWVSGSAPALKTAASAVDVIALFSSDGGTTWSGMAVNNTGFLGGSCRAYHNTTQSISTSYVALAFNSETFDNGGYHDPVTNNTRITIPTGKDGLYVISGCCTTASGNLSSYIRLNGATILAYGTQSSAGTTTVFAIRNLVATDYVEFMCKSSGASTINGDEPCFFAVAYSGPTA